MKNSNLRKLVRNLTQYYHEDLRKTADFAQIDQQEIARQATPDAVAVLVEFVAAAAVTCPEKGRYVGRIMTMTPESQAAMKEIIESSLQRLTDYEDEEDGEEENEMVFGGTVDDEDESHFEPSAKDEDDPLFYPHADLEKEQQVADLQREVAQLKSQATVAEEESNKAQDKLRGLVEDLQDRLRKRQDDLSQVEQDLQKVTAELQDTQAKLAATLEEKAQLADDLDVAQSKAQQLRKAEATVVAYKKKLDSVGVMNQQMTELEEQAAGYMRQIVDLENEVKKSNALQKTVHELQEQIAELEKLKSHTDSSTKTSVSEIAELKSQLQASESAKKMFEEELQELRAQQEVAAEDAAAPPAVVASLSKEDREKTLRLEVENKKLQEEVAKLQAQAAASSEKSVPAVDPGLQQRVSELEEQLALKEQENAKISGDKDKLEAYTKRTLAKFQDKYLVALQECKAKLK